MVKLNDDYVRKHLNECLRKPFNYDYYWVDYKKESCFQCKYSGTCGDQFSLNFMCSNRKNSFRMMSACIRTIGKCKYFESV